MTSFSSSFPWTPRHRERKHCLWQYKTKRERCLSKLNSFSFSFCTCGAACAHSALVIPAGWSVSAPDAHRRHFFRLTLHSLMRFSTLKFRTKIYLIFSSSTADLVRYSLGKSICNCNRGIRDSNSTTLKFVILCEPIKDFILFSQPP